MRYFRITACSWLLKYMYLRLGGGGKECVDGIGPTEYIPVELFSILSQLEAVFPHSTYLFSITRYHVCANWFVSVWHNLRQEFTREAIRIIITMNDVT